MLRRIEEMERRHVSPDAFRVQLDASIAAHLTVPSRSSPADPARVDPAASRAVDVASHFVLRAAHCRTAELRRWFAARECRLFRHRLERLAAHGGGDDDDGAEGGGEGGGGDAYAEFLTRHVPHLERLSAAETERRRARLDPDAPPEQYAVPFVQALDLVARRECVVAGGRAYLPRARAGAVAAAAFRAALVGSLARGAGARGPALRGEAGRLVPLLAGLGASRDPGPAAGAAGVGGAVPTAGTVDALAARSMPLCMRRLHAGLTQHRKLKHRGRLQYGLFLKGAGMTPEEHLRFFEREFTRVMSRDQFRRQYAYSIRHLHGKEGRRVGGTPYSCQKIILGDPPRSAVEHHGCPYKHCGDDSLRALLDELGVGNAAERAAIVAHKKDGEFHLACAKHFEAAHPLAAGMEGASAEGIGHHPNAWFAASVQYHDSMSSRNKAVDMEGTA